jgi:hypothetical protein
LLELRGTEVDAACVCYKERRRPAAATNGGYADGAAGTEVAARTSCSRRLCCCWLALALDVEPPSRSRSRASPLPPSPRGRQPGGAVRTQGLLLARRRRLEDDDLVELLDPPVHGVTPPRITSGRGKRALRGGRLQGRTRPRSTSRRPVASHTRSPPHTCCSPSARPRRHCPRPVSPRGRPPPARL